MNKILAAVLLSSGIVGISFFGYRLIDGDLGSERKGIPMPGSQATENVTDTGFAALLRKPLLAPSDCDLTRTGVFFDVCQNQSDAKRPALPWDNDLNDFEENCILEAFHATNRQVLRLRQRDYQPEPPSSARVINFACDVAMAAFSERQSLDQGPDASASAALTAFFKKRASIRHGSEIFY